MLDAKIAALAAFLGRSAPALVAVSGGLDSRFLARMARDHATGWRAVLFRGPHQTPAELDWATAWLDGLGLPGHVVDCNPLDEPGVAANTRERCYLCKKACFSKAVDLARDLGLALVCDGTNASDASEFRPGLKALAELDVRSPLAEAGLAKDDIREAAKRMGLERWDQPARACLLTRFGYGVRPDPDILGRLGLAEDGLAALGLREFRLRVPGPGRVVLQVSAAEAGLWEQVGDRALALLADHGLEPGQVEAAGKVSGYYDRS